jgi:hypothetical protein
MIEFVCRRCHVSQKNAGMVYNAVIKQWGRNIINDHGFCSRCVQKEEDELEKLPRRNFGLGSGSTAFDVEEDNVLIYRRLRLDTAEKMSVDAYFRHHEIAGEHLRKRRI